MWELQKFKLAMHFSNDGRRRAADEVRYPRGLS